MAITLASFLHALGMNESGGDYNARNPDSGAFGKYQFMPDTWRYWAERLGLGADAPMTPENQETVARGAIQSIFDQYGNWRDVAAVWYSGQPWNAETAHNKQGDYPSIDEYTTKMLSDAQVPGPPATGNDGSAASSTSGTAAATPEQIAEINAKIVDLSMKCANGDVEACYTLGELIKGRDAILGKSPDELTPEERAQMGFTNDMAVYDRQVDAWANQVKLGEMDLAEADREYQRWVQKNQEALDAAAAESQRQWTVAGEQKKNYTDPFIFTGSGANVPGRPDAIIGMMKEQMGVGDPPPIPDFTAPAYPQMPTPPDLSGDSSATAGGAGAGGGTQEIVPTQGKDDNGAIRPRNDPFSDQNTQRTSSGGGGSGLSTMDAVRAGTRFIGQGVLNSMPVVGPVLDTARTATAIGSDPSGAAASFGLNVLGRMPGMNVALPMFNLFDGMSGGAGSGAARDALNWIGSGAPINRARNAPRRWWNRRDDAMGVVNTVRDWF